MLLMCKDEILLCSSPKAEYWYFLKKRMCEDLFEKHLCRNMTATINLNLAPACYSFFFVRLS